MLALFFIKKYFQGIDRLFAALCKSLFTLGVCIFSARKTRDNVQLDIYAFWNKFTTLLVASAILLTRLSHNSSALRFSLR